MPGATHNPTLPNAVAAVDPPLYPLAVLLALAALIGFIGLPADPDLWFHLADGRTILGHDAIPRVDPYSFTRENDLWVPHSWLFDVGAYALWTQLGPRATEAVFALAFMVTIAASFSLLTARGVAPLVALVLCCAVAVGAGNTRGIRPQVLSLLLCNLLILALIHHRARPSLRLWIVSLPLFLLWAQVHAACVLGLAVIGLWSGGRVLDALRSRSLAAASRTELLLLGGAMAIAVAAVLATPHAISHFAYVELTSDLEFLRTRVSEWQPPRLISLAVPDVYLTLLIAGVAVLLIRARGRVGFAELALAVPMILLATTALRHIPLAWIAAVPLVADAFHARAANRLVAAPAARGESAAPRWRLRPRDVAALAVAISAALGFAWRIPSDVAARYATSEPIRGAAALTAMNRPLRVFTSYNTGAYVLWSAPTWLRVSVDSRADVYGDEVLWRADAAARGEQWQSLMDDWRVDAVVVGRRDALARALRSHTAWNLLAEDPAALTFVRREIVSASQPGCDAVQP